MSTNIVYNGVTYTIPATDDVAWGDAVSNFLIAIPDGMLTKVGGAWALTGSDLDLGAAYGLSVLYLKTKTATPALSGVIRLAYADAIAYRAEANNKDLVLKPNSSNFLTWDNIVLCDISSAQVLTNKAINAPDNTITEIKNVNISATAAIDVSKINFTAASIAWETIDTVGKIKNVDVASDAAIVGSKIDPDFGTQAVKLGNSFKASLTADPTENYGIELPKVDGTTGQALAKSIGGELEWVTIPGLSLNQFHIIVGNASNATADVDTNLVGDIKVDESLGATIKALAITDAMINASAAIVFSKMAALTVSRALVSDGSGVVSVATTTAAEIGYVSGVTSAIQTQIGTKVTGPASAVDSNFASFDTTTGKLVKDSGSKAADFATAASVAPLIAAVTATSELTGFEDNANVVVTYASGSQEITLTHSSGTIYYWVSGVRLSLTSPWTSTAHTNTVGANYWLSISGAGASVWTTNASPGFDKCIVANCVYYTAYKFAMREVHGVVMDHQTHKELHNAIGTYRGSGGSAVAASYAVLTNTIAAVTPNVDSVVINDEDLPTTLAAFTSAEGYTQLYFDTNAATFVTGAALPYLVTGTPGAGNPRYNQNPISGTALTEITNNNRWFNVYTIFVPVTADAASQAYRMMWLTGQQIYTTLSAAQSEDFRTVALGNLQSLFSEFLPYIRWSFIRTGSNLTYATQVAATPTYLLGTAASLVSVSGFNPVDHNALTGRSDADSHPASAITGTAVTLAGAEELTNKKLTGGTASTSNEWTIPNKSDVTSLTDNIAGNIIYDTTANKLKVSDGSGTDAGWKVVGGGLIPTNITVSGTTPSIATLESGKQYVYNGAGASGNVTVTMPAVAAESNLRITVYNIPSPYKLIVARAGSDQFRKDDTLYTTVEFVAVEVEQSSEFVAATAANEWLVNDGSNALGTTWGGALTVTGAFTPSGGIVGKTDGVAVAAGYVGEYRESVAGADDLLSNITYSDSGVTVLALPAGVWDIQASSEFTPITGTTTLLNAMVAVGTATGDDSNGMDAQRNQARMGWSSQTVGGQFTLVTPVWRVRISATTNYYCKSWAQFGGSTLTAKGSLTARRKA